MTREEQFEVLKMTWIFEQTVERLSDEAKKLKLDKPKSPISPIKPIEPKENRVQVTPLPYPEIIPPEIESEAKMDGKSFVKKHGIGMVVGGALYAGLMVKNALDESKQKAEQRKRMIEEIRNSQEYKDKCSQIDEENRLRQEAMDRQLHEEYLREYEEYKKSFHQYSVELEQYHRDFEEYNVEIIPDWIEEIEMLQIALEDAKNALQDLYNKNVLPLPYQNRKALYYIVSYMASSDSNLEYIIERYDTHITHGKLDQISDGIGQGNRLLRDILSEQQYENYLNEEMTDLISSGNATLKSISSLQKFDFGLREYRRIKARRAVKKHR